MNVPERELDSNALFLNVTWYLRDPVVNNNHKRKWQWDTNGDINNNDY
jgi:hypothetical protein